MSDKTETISHLQSLAKNPVPKYIPEPTTAVEIPWWRLSTEYDRSSLKEKSK